MWGWPQVGVGPYTLASRAPAGGQSLQLSQPPGTALPAHSLASPRLCLQSTRPRASGGPKGNTAHNHRPLLPPPQPRPAGSGSVFGICPHTGVCCRPGRSRVARHSGLRVCVCACACMVVYVRAHVDGPEARHLLLPRASLLLVPSALASVPLLCRQHKHISLLAN